jgi:serine/threonine-protein kinase
VSGNVRFLFVCRFSNGYNPGFPIEGSLPDRSDRLESWKEIAAYLGRTEKTARRWEQREGLPVHRLQHQERGSIYAFKSELDAWRAARQPTPELANATEEPWQPRRWGVLTVLTVATIGAMVFTGYSTVNRLRMRSSSPGSSRIAVLPFKSLGDSTHAQFAAAITEEVTTRLAGVLGLHVVSRTSADEHQRAGKKTSDIGRDLGAEYVLEGSVLWNQGSVEGGGSQIRITAQLIRAVDDVHLWAQTYDHEFTDLFKAQNDIATRVVREVRGQLAPADLPITQGQATRNPDAYRAYLEGRFYASRPDFSEENLLLTIRSFERAVALDAEFTVALAALTRAQIEMVRLGYDLSQERRTLIRQNVERLRRGPSAAEMHIVLGSYWITIEHDPERGLAEFEAAERLEPANPEIPSLRSRLLQRVGHWDESIAELRRIVDQRPHDAFVLARIALACNAVGRYAEAQHYANRSIALEPDQVLGYLQKVWGVWLWKRDLDGARLLIEELPDANDWRFVELRFLQALYERKYEAAVRALAPLSGGWMRTTIIAWPTVLYEAQVWRLAGDLARAHEKFETARRLLEAEVRDAPDDARLHISLGIAYAGLGRKTDALREKEQTLAFPLARIGFEGSVFIELAALISTMVGDHDAALSHLQTLLAMPAHFSPQLLRLDPRWDPLRAEPGYTRLASE